MSATQEQVTPREIGQGDERHLRIVWADGHVSDLDVVELRRACPCASCIDEWSGRPRLDPGSIPDTLRPVNVSSVGLYALSIGFTDGHDSGIFTFDLLRSLCPCPACRA